MNKRLIAIMAPMALIGSLLFSTATFAQCYRPTRTPGINTNQQYQQERIQEGRYTGQLTRAETIRLEAEQQRILQEKRAAKADGYVTPAEREAIHRDQRHASHDIYRAKHNDWSRGWTW